MKRLLLVAVFLQFICPALAQTPPIEYTLTIKDPVLHLYDVQMEISGVRTESVDVAMPAWSPGVYAIRDFARNVQEFGAATRQNRPLSWEQIDKQTWRIMLARRLIEAGARFVTVNQAVQGGLFGKGQTNGTWDNHGWLFDSMMSFGAPPAGVASKDWHSYNGPGNLPQLDMSLSTLLEDLHQRGLLETTLVVVMGEFGRTPKINKTSGRDHYPQAGNVLLAGAGVKGGAVIGATDPIGSAPATRPWGPADFAASIYHALGIDPHTTYYPRLPRPTPLAEGEVIHGLFA